MKQNSFFKFFPKAAVVFALLFLHLPNTPIHLSSTTFANIAQNVIAKTKHSTNKPLASNAVGEGFSASTNITMADGSQKPIGKVLPNEKVLTYNSKSQELEARSFFKVEQFRNGLDNKDNVLIELAFDNGMVVQSGLAHPYYVVGKGWAAYAPNMTKQTKHESSLATLQIGDNVLFFNNKNGKQFLQTTLLASKMIEAKGKTYTLINVEQNHNFFANGLLVHNHPGEHGNENPSSSSSSKEGDPNHHDKTPSTNESLTKENQEKLNEKTKEKNSQEMGDPVRISTGSYLYTENDLIHARSYTSGRSIFSKTTGNAWASNLSVSIVRGTQPGILKYYNIIKKGIEDANKERQGSNKKDDIAHDRLLKRIWKEYNYTMQMHALNMRGEYFDYPKAWSEVGNGHLVLLDEHGTPHLFLWQGKEDENENNQNQNKGVWLPQDEQKKQYQVLKSKDGLGAESTAGFVLYDKGGVEKHFDGWGLLQKIVYAQNAAQNKEVLFLRNSNNRVVQVIDEHKRNYIFTYNSDGLVHTITDSVGQQVVYEYQNKLLKKVTDADGDTVVYDYAGTNLTAIIKPDGSRIQITYANGRAIATTDEEGNRESFVYDVLGKKTTYKNHSGVQSVYTYNDSHRTVEEILPTGVVVQYQYDDKGNKISEVQNGNITRFSYDVRGNLNHVLYGDASNEVFGYNAKDQLTFYKDRDGMLFRYEYDSFGNRIKQYNNNILVWTGKYNDKGFLIESQVVGLNPYQYVYNSQGFLVEKKIVVDGVARVEQYQVDAIGRVQSYNNALGQKWSYRYSQKTVTEVSPFNLVKTFTYNNRKDLVQVEETDTYTNQTRRSLLHYDRRHLLKEIIDSENNRIVYEYRADGKRSKERQGNWTSEYVYNGAGQIYSISKKKWNTNGTVETAFTRRYNYQQTLQGQRQMVTNAVGAVTVYQHDRWNRVVQKTNAVGERFAMAYSAQGKRTKEQTASGGFITYNYTNGKLTQAGKEHQEQMAIVYNDNGSVRQETDRTGATTSYQYNEAGEVTQITKPYGSIVYRYDALGRVLLQTAHTNANGHSYVTRYEYHDKPTRQVTVYNGKYKKQLYMNAWGELIKETEGEQTIVYTRNNIGQVIQIDDAMGLIGKYRYNAIGLLESQENALQQKTRYRYNALGTLQAVLDAQGFVLQRQFDKAARITQEKRRGKPKQRYEYDRIGRVTKIYSANVLQAEYYYGSYGRTMQVKDGKGNIYQYQKDAYGLLTKETNRLNKSQEFAYDGEERLQSQQKFDNSVIKTSYNAAHNSETIGYQDGSQRVIQKDILGNVIQVVGASGMLHYHYDSSGRLITTIDAQAALTTKYVYNPNNGQLMRMTNKARDEKYIRNARNQITWTQDQISGHSVHLDYDVLGRETMRRFGNGMSEKRNYDKAGRLKAIQTFDRQKNLLNGEAYVYDNEGRKIFVVNQEAKVTSYHYDKQFRIRKVEYAFTEKMRINDKKETQKAGLRPPLFGAYADPKRFTVKESQQLLKAVSFLKLPLHVYFKEEQSVWTVDFTYDANGNRLTKQTKWGVIEYRYDRENRLRQMGDVTYTYDDNGNLLKENIDYYQRKEYRYNQDDRMTHSAVYDFWHLQGMHSRYEYDGLGRRTLWGEVNNPLNKKAVRASYEGLSLHKLGEWQVNANNFSIGSGGSFGFGSPSSSKQFFYNENDNDALGIARSDGITAQVRYFAKDGLGSVRAELGSHVVQQRYDYDIFGTPQNLSYRQNIDSGYTGKPFDGTTGLSDYGFRDYAPQMARFTTVDPIRDGHNWYVYVNNDPVNWVDAWGLSASDKKVGKAAVYPTYGNALNFDFGFDYLQMAVENFKNGHPLTGAVLTIDAAAELTYNAVASYGVASQLSKSLPAATAFVQTKAGELRSFIQSGAVQQAVRGWFGKKGLRGSGKGSQATRATNFVIDPSGQVFPVPNGARGPIPVVNSSGKINGSAFTGGSSGMNGKVNSIRIMNSTIPRGKSPGYPAGYIKYENKVRQGVNPYTGQTLPRSESHYPIKISK